MQSILGLANHYGYIILFSSLVLELIAFPLPGELMMTYCGFLVYASKMNWIMSILLATAGVILGITISYFVGTKVGTKFLEKYGSYIHLGSERLRKTSLLFNSNGNKLLIFAYFIPGVRHIMGYFSGMMEIRYKRFALNSYLGALIWTTTFISLGKVLGPNWEIFHSFATKYMIIGAMGISFILLATYTYKNYKTQVIEFTYKIFNRTIVTFHSMRKMKIVIVTALLSIIVLVIGLTQDFDYLYLLIT